jgi:hypothetical protein
VNILLWGSSIYIAVFQTLTLVFRKPFWKRFSEIALSLGSALIFILFYAYLDLRISVTASFAKGEIDAETMAQALRIQSFLAVFEKFIRAPQHLFALFGVISFDFLLLVARMRAITLEHRLTRIIEMPQEANASSMLPDRNRKIKIQRKVPAKTARAGGRRTPREPAGAIADCLLRDCVSSDIIGFTDLSEQLGRTEATAQLNRYYGIWNSMRGKFRWKNRIAFGRYRRHHFRPCRC